MNKENKRQDDSKMMEHRFYLFTLICPKSVINKIASNNQIDIMQLLVAAILSICSKLLRGNTFSIIMFAEVIASILIFVIFLKVIFWLAKGEISFFKVINLSVYIHIWVILANMCSRIPMLSITAFIGAQLLGVYLQYLAGIQIAHSDANRLKSICLVELFLVLFSIVMLLLTSWGKYMAYSSKTYYFPLVVNYL